MKKSAFYTTIVMIVLIVCCLTAVTFSFFTSRSGNTIFELGSKTSTKFNISFDNTKEQIITGENAVQSNGSTAFWVIDYETGGTDYRNMYFTMSELEYVLENSPSFNSSRQPIGIDPLTAGMVIDKNSANAVYMDSIIQFSFVKIPRIDQIQEGKEHLYIPKTVADPNNPSVQNPITFDQVASMLQDSKYGLDDTHWSGWKNKMKMSTDCFNLDAIPGKTGNANTKGQLVLFIKIKQGIDNELLPPAMNGVQVKATIESTEL